MDHQQRVVIMAIQQHVQRFEVMLATGVIAEIQWVSNIHGFQATPGGEDRWSLRWRAASLPLRSQSSSSASAAGAAPLLIIMSFAAQWAHMAEGFHRRERKFRVS